MKLLALMTTAALALTLVAAAPLYAQEQHEQEEQKAKPEEKQAQPEKSTKQEEKPAAQPEKNAKQEEKSAPQPQQKAQPAQRTAGNGGARIPADRYKASFGQQHTFRVSQTDYRNHRFEYGGYAFGFIDPWPSNWLYTQNVYVVEINGMYYLCNASFPGVNLALSFTL